MNRVMVRPSRIRGHGTTSRGRKITAAVFALAAGCVDTTPVAKGASCKGSLDLEAYSQQEIPRAAQIFGLDRGRDGSVVYWTRAGELYVLSAGTTPPGRAITGLGHVVSAAFVSDSMISAVVRSPNRVVTLRSNGDLATTNRVKVGGTIIDAALRDGYWALAAVQTDRSFSVLAESDSGLKSLLQLPPRPAGDSTYSRMRLSSANSAPLLLTSSSWPFEVRTLGPMLTDARVLSRAAEALPLLANKDSMSVWGSQPALPLDCGTVQLIADQASNRRVMILRDSDGSTIRVRTINAPLGFVQSRPADSTIVAVRTLDIREVVAYRWKRSQ